MAGERAGTRKSKRVAALETKKPRKSPKTISLSDLPKRPAQNKQPKAARKSGPAPKHPTYFQMVVEAIVMLKERAGSSRQAIAKFISERYRKDLPDNFRRLMNNHLRTLTAKGKLVQVRGSFKLPEDVKNSKQVKELKKSAAVHVTVGAPKKTEKNKAKVPKTMRAKPAAKPPVAAKKNKKSEATPKKMVTVKKEIASSISGRGRQKPEVAGSNPRFSTATRKSGRVARSVSAGPTNPAKKRGRK